MQSSVQQGPILYDDARSVLLFGARNARSVALRQIVQELGGRVIEANGFTDAVERLDAQIAIDAVVVDAGDGDGDGDAPGFDALVARLNRAAQAGDYPSVIILPPALIDVAAKEGWHADIALLCDPDPFEQAAAIGTALAEREMVLNDISADGGNPPRLRQLSEEVSRIARVLATMSGDEQLGVLTAPRPDVPVPARRGSDAIIDAMQVRAMIRARRLRELYFPADLFADPAWDMLLDLMAARLERRQVAVSSLCIAAAVPPTTALRWIKLLTDQGILIRIADPTDGRRVFIELAEAAAEGMMNYLAAAQRLATIAP
ncbi:MarR family transcriptional regulator [Sphingomonas profundi]|uniref:MarR family transcriptional regulator n=1 Tax=Alterirhizorhabdus profundi TaxID=2681549 RepID=UPI0012E88476|nr:MarR family transcriptional regulator [Sphingomonas profundi]